MMFISDFILSSLGLVVISLMFDLQLENKELAKGYSEVTVDADEVAVVASPGGSAHALMNVDTIRSTFMLGCQDAVVNYHDNSTDFGVWKDLH